MNEEDFLKRWSRRKREAADTLKPEPPPAERKSGGAVPRDRTGVDNSEMAPEAAFDPSTLLPIDSITAVTDVTAFLRAGVPADLTRAALRRAWVADPVIRDFVGLAENAWDFTDPAAMPGFGPLESTEEVRRLIAQVVDQIGKGTPTPTLDIAEAPPDVSEHSSDPKEITATKTEPEAGRPPVVDVENREDRAQELNPQLLPQSSERDIASHLNVTEAEAKEKPTQLPRRRHGGALPKIIIA